MRTFRVRLVVAACLACAPGALPGGRPRAAYGQIPGLPQVQTGGKAGEAELPPGVERRGLNEAAGVSLDGRELFKIASSVVFNRAEPGDLIPVEVRAWEIEAKLQRLLSRGTEAGAAPQRGHVTRLDPDTLHVRIETRNGQPVLFATDARGAEPEELLTVTDFDAQYHGLTAMELSGSWQEILEQELRRALEQRRPQAARRLVRLTGILLGTSLGTVFLGALTSALWRRKQWLRQRQQEAEQATAFRAAASQAATAHASTSRQAAAPQVAGEGVAASAGIVYQFPQTRGIADRIVSTPVLILIAWFVAGLVNGFAGLLIDRIATAWGRTDRRTDDPRASLRVPTVVNALKGLTAAILYTVAVEP